MRWFLPSRRHGPHTEFLTVPVRARSSFTLAETSARTRVAVSTLSKVENEQLSLIYDKLAQLSYELALSAAASDAC